MKKLATLILILASAFSFGKINPGEIIILGFESSTGGGAVQEVWFVALAPIDAGEVVYMTDHSISSTAPFTLGVDSKDSWLSFTVGPNGLNVGDTWIIGDLTAKGGATPSLTTARSSVTTSDITNIQFGGAFTLTFGQNGDDLILYQGNSTQAGRFIYGVGADAGASQFDPAVTGNITRFANWGLTQGLTANFFNNGNSNYKLLGANPDSINFNGTIDEILTDLGNPDNYVYDVSYLLNDVSGGLDLSLGAITPQPSNRFYNAADGLWYTDQAFTTLAIDPNRTHTVVVVTTSFDVAANDTLDVAGIVVGDSTTPTTVQALDGSVVQTVYGIQVTNAGTFVMEGDAQVHLGTDFDVNAGGTAVIQPGAHLDFNGDLIVDGVMTLNADATGFSTLGLHGTTTQQITGTGTINAEMYFAYEGWYHLSAPGSITFDNVSFDNTMNLSFAGSSRNVYRWDPDPASGGDPGWYYTKSTSDFGDSAFTVYFAAAHLPTTMTLSYVADDMDADVVNGVHDYTTRYKVGATNPNNSSDGWAVGNGNDGWNLMKNPYWGHLSWAAVDDNLPAGLQAAVYFWNPGQGQYDTWVDGSADPYYDISPLLAYFAKATGPTAAGQAVQRAQSHVFDGTQNYFGKIGVAKPQLALIASSGTASSKVDIIFDDEATDRFDGRYDAYFRGVNPGEVYFNSISEDSITMRIDQRPFPNPGKSIYLTYDFDTDGADGRIALDNSNLPYGVYAYLEDVYTQTIVDLQAGDYFFSHADAAPRQRFILHLNNTAVSTFEFAAVANPLFAYRAHESLLLQAEGIQGERRVQLIDMTGRVVVDTRVDFNMDGRGELTVPGFGPYVVRVIDNEQVLTVKTF